VAVHGCSTRPPWRRWHERPRGTRRSAIRDTCLRFPPRAAWTRSTRLPARIANALAPRLPPAPGAVSRRGRSAPPRRAPAPAFGSAARRHVSGRAASRCLEQSGNRVIPVSWASLAAATCSDGDAEGLRRGIRSRITGMAGRVVRIPGPRAMRASDQRRAVGLSGAASSSAVHSA